MTSDEWNYFWNITNVFGVTFDQINASFLDKSITLLKKSTDPKLLYSSVQYVYNV